MTRPTADPCEQLRGYLQRYKQGDRSALRAARQLLRRFGLRIIVPSQRLRWSDAAVELLRSLYPDTPMPELVRRLGCPADRIYAKANKLKLRRSPEYLASPAACRLRRGGEVGKAHRFPKGHVPANKGQRRPGFASGRMATTQFKKGQMPHTWRPIGHERVMDGYLQRKVTDTGYTPRDYRPVHHLLWEEHNGLIPDGHVLCFVNGNRAEIRIENLECITRVELMRRNTVHNLPQPLVKVIQLRGALKRQIRKKEKQS